MEVEFFFKFIYFERKRENTHARTQIGEGQTERERERNPSRLHTVSAGPHMGLDPTNREIRNWAEIKSWALTHRATPAPQ